MSRNDAKPIGSIPTRAFGKTGIEVTVTGLGGEGIKGLATLTAHGPTQEVRAITGRSGRGIRRIEPGFFKRASQQREARTGPLPISIKHSGIWASITWICGKSMT
jgi:hypothetical protein